MEEMFETYSDDDVPTGLVARSLVHKLGLWHKASNVFLFRTDGRLVTQRRHASKDVWPNSWDLSVAEHLKPGESYLEAAIRGLNEELGVTGVDLEPAGNELRAVLEVAESGIKDCERQMCFRGVSDAETVPQADEVAEIRLYDLEELKTAMLESPNSFTPWFREHALDVGLFK